MNGSKPCIQVINLQLESAGRPLLRNLNMQVNCGVVTALVGRNPAVWNHLLRQIAGKQPIIDGQIEIWGVPVSQIPRRTIDSLICHIPLQEKPIFAYSVMEFIMQGCEVSMKPMQTPQACDHERAMQIMKQLKIEKLGQRDSSLLNSIELQLVLLARGLMQNARLFLLDDPVSHLKPAAQLETMTLLLEKVKQNSTALIAFQDPWLAVQLADQLVVFDEDGIAAVLYRKQPDFAAAAEYVLNQLLTLDNDGHLLDNDEKPLVPGGQASLNGSLPPEKESSKKPKSGFIF